MRSLQTIWHLDVLLLDSAASFLCGRYSSHQSCNCWNLVVVVWRRRPRIARRRYEGPNRWLLRAAKALGAHKPTVVPTVDHAIGSNMSAVAHRLAAHENATYNFDQLNVETPCTLQQPQLCIFIMVIWLSTPSVVLQACLQL